MHHRLQCPDNGLFLPVSYGPTEVGSPGDSWFSCGLGKVLFFSWNVCCKASLRDQAFLPMKNSVVLLVRYGLVSSDSRPKQEVFTMQIAKHLSMQQQLLLSLWLSQTAQGYWFSVATP